MFILKVLFRQKGKIGVQHGIENVTKPKNKQTNKNINFINNKFL